MANDPVEMLRKQEVVGTTNTPGWRVIQYLAEQIVAGRERLAIDEDDDEKAAKLRRDARAARLFMSDFFNLVENYKQSDAALDESFEESYT